MPSIPEPEESAHTFWENARLKAFAYDQAVRESGVSTEAMMVVAEDSGLEIAGLDGEPGVHSARFLGAGVPYADRFAEIYRRLDRQPGLARHARFVTALAVVPVREVLFETEASIDGVIAPRTSRRPRLRLRSDLLLSSAGKRPPPNSRSMRRAMVSHRARAFRDFARWLRHAEFSVERRSAVT